MCFNALLQGGRAGRASDNLDLVSCWLCGTVILGEGKCAVHQFKLHSTAAVRLHAAMSGQHSRVSSMSFSCAPAAHCVPRGAYHASTAMPCNRVQDAAAFSRVCQAHMHNHTMFPAEHDYAVMAARHLGFEDVTEAKQSDFEKFAAGKDLVSACAMLLLPQCCQMLFALKTIVPLCMPAASSGACPAPHWPCRCSTYMSACQPSIATRRSSLCTRNQCWPTFDPGILWCRVLAERASTAATSTRL